MATSGFFKVFKKMALLGNGIVKTKTLSAGYTILARDPNILLLSAAASQDVTLPAVAANPGMFYIVKATGANSIVLKNVGGSTIVTVTTGKIGLVFCDGASWHNLGVIAAS